jgi:hypothetical protein
MAECVIPMTPITGMAGVSPYKSGQPQAYNPKRSFKEWNTSLTQFKAIRRGEMV